ncbi:hypothetical protein KK060_04440 [Fulvivirgaceae bacterium PWU20]|uniref:Zinc-finger domain-containing protein n=2 Tax=Chryseosolibacter indicus TaxID=2782351 RepID=A0ABS5VNU8_9BACT|nr:hypothetical protein [Chryseosolibacter indicus]
MEDFEIKVLAYLDNTMSKSDRDAFEQLIESEKHLKLRFEEIRHVDFLLRSEPLQQPPKDFTSNVISNLHQRPVEASAISIVRSLLLLSGIIMVVVICVILVTNGRFDTMTALVDLGDLNLASKYVHKNLPAISIGGRSLINVIILLNLLLGLLILDKGILRPLFQKRMHAG